MLRYVLKVTIGHQEALVVLKESWTLVTVSDKQQLYLMAKFHIDQTTGRKLDVEIVARGMQRAQDPNVMHLFQPAKSGPAEPNLKLNLRNAEPSSSVDPC